MATAGVSKVINTVFSDPDLRKKLVDAETPEARRAVLVESGLAEGLTEEDYASLREISADAKLLGAEVLASVSGGNNTTYASDINGAPVLYPSANAGGATIAGDVVVAGSVAVTSTAMGAAAIGVVVGGAAFGF